MVYIIVVKIYVPKEEANEEEKNIFFGTISSSMWKNTVTNI